MIKVSESKNTSLTPLLFGFFSILITFFLFYFMAQLISGGKKIVDSRDSENIIEFVRLKRPTQTEIRKRELPKKPEVTETPKAQKSLNLNNDVKPTRPNMNFESPALDIPLALGSGGMGIAGGGGSAGGNSDEMPLVRVEPQFPTEAAMKGVETGWVRLIFDVRSDGTVSNVRVVQSSPRGVFDMAAKRAVLKWKYRPKKVEGKSVGRKNLKVQIDFGLE